MIKIDRSTAPERHKITSIELLQPVEKKLDNGISFYEIKGGSQPVLRLEFIFDAGTKRQTQPLVASFTNSMLTEGTTARTAEQIATSTDYYGAFLQTGIDNDTSHVTLHCLTRVFPDVFPVMADVITDPIFPDRELSIHLRNAKQKFIVNSDKVEFLSRKKFNEELFGKDHPYGMQAEVEDFDQVNSVLLKNFFKEFYANGDWKIIASGQFGDEVFNLVNSILGKIKVNPVKRIIVPTDNFPKASKYFVAKDNALQSGIRIGKILFNKTHPDYQKIQVLNTALGGYFGSRLMANIREDKGYTYGIGSAVVSLYDTGYFFITTDVGKDVTAKALKEIYYEINRIRDEKMDEEELDTVKNYMLGSFLRNSEGPFAMADRFKALLGFDLDYSYYDQWIETINEITPEEINRIAINLLNPDTLTEVVAGNPE